MDKGCHDKSVRARNNIDPHTKIIVVDYTCIGCQKVIFTATAVHNLPQLLRHINAWHGLDALLHPLPPGVAGFDRTKS